MNFPSFRRAPFVAPLLALLLTTAPAWARDPFRTTNPRPIGIETRKAFDLLFRDGNFPQAVRQLDVALRKEAGDPLPQALRAAVAYIREDFIDMKVYSDRTRDRAQALLKTDRLRGHLYLGVSYLMEAGYIVRTQGLTSAPRALPIVQRALDELNNASAIDPRDPELNLIKGYMDMLIASVVPLADLDSALGSLRQFATPDYLKWRGIALGYRDAKRFDQALDAVNRAIAIAPNNPELYYLRGQILWLKGGTNLNEARTQYLLALRQSSQLPPPLVGTIRVECRNLTAIIKGQPEECPR
ncbi:MAG: tetratricopeptide repeat protein [Oscillatoriales cyanobacterium SM2_2_1]|nr:tetratricopeptide repeat protein [Oscillatoriales cyanobacterium SM2_2_1]